MNRKQNVYIAYNFFPHYRTPVFNELNKSKHFNFFYAANKFDPYVSKGDLIESSEICKQPNFVNLPCYLFFKHRILLQPKLITLPFKKDVHQIIYHGNPWWPCTWLSVLIAKSLGKKTYFWTHGWYRKESGIKSLLYNAFFRLPHGNLLYGHMSKCLAINEGINPDKLHVIYNSLDFDKQNQIRDSITEDDIQQTRQQLFPNSNAPIIVACARLTKLKKFHLLIEAAANLKKQGHNLNILLIGNGPEKDNLKKQAQNANLSLNLFGPCYDETQLAKLIMASKVTVMPGEVGLTAMQSLNFGTPVITHDDYAHQMPEWEAIIPNKNGSFFTNNDIPTLQAAIKNWTQTPDNSPQIKDNCTAIIHRLWNPHKQVQIIENALRGNPANDFTSATL
ncbi:glycogen synthase [Poriferisphaera corsica]|uniref:Glycogen synthase n=1 Tax=Poriferisphaera corsica TaxID=2528020 RepID=A0A517YQ08_9BACT|nr:glycosyltransferase [Poriferisphaera corsica]QDU32292.1 glycogen synthase [Poriferisphaera corsica]